MKSYWKVPDVDNSDFFQSLLIVLLLITGSTIYAADTPLLERTITITLKQERTDNALKRISEQGGFVFSYNPAIVDVNKVVTFNFRAKTVREILDEMFAGAIDYKQRKNYIILTKRQSKDANIVSGYVTDETTGERLKNVTVYDPATLSSAVTDDYGFFKLKVENPNAIIAVNRVNYTDTVVAVPNRLGLLKIQIKNRTDRINTLTDSLRKKFMRIWNVRVLGQQDIHAENVHDTLYRKTQISVLPFIGTNHKLSANVINDYSFNVFGGYSLGVRKLEVGAFCNIERGDVQGLQMAGYFNGVFGDRQGVQLSGAINATYGESRGFQLAGSGNMNRGSMYGVAAAGLFNMTGRNSSGTLFAGAANIAFGEQRGTHAAGLVNFSLHDARVLQLAGLLNVAVGDMNGAQIGGFTNFTRKRLTGVQLAGVVNYARKINGAQIGLINISDSIKGVPLGLLSFSWHGYHKLEIFADEIFYTNIALKTGVRQFYNIFTAGMKLGQTESNFWSVGYGLGTAPKLSKKLSLNVDLTANQVSDGNFTKAINLVNKFYAGLEWHIIPKASIFAGATLNGYVTDTTYRDYKDLFRGYRPTIFYEKTYGNNTNMKMWWSARVGIRFL